MIIGVDIGGTKTLVAEFSDNGKILRERKFATPKDYDEFIATLAETVNKLEIPHVQAVCVAVPGLLNRRSGIVKALGNLDWRDKNIRSDIRSHFETDHIYIENDSKLAGLSEVRSLPETPDRTLYLTVSTGIGGALLIGENLSSDMIDMELGKSPLLFEDEVTHWEDFASGRAFTEAYGAQGDDVDDSTIWQQYVQERLGPGVIVACSYLQVDTIIFGGGLGHHSNQFAAYLLPYLDERLHAIVKRPSQILSAKHGKNAVIYGCYEYAHDKL
ncbi:ROK family protein [Candidatus Saccharibacteria bacterium]|nr:ROK family protein [Candidatus Saccharibacteria bacterium]